MNKYDFPYNLAEVMVKEEDHLYDGSFSDYLNIKRGRNSVFLPAEELRLAVPILADLYPGAGLKMFGTDNKLCKMTQIQRIFSWYGLAPKIYRRVELEDRAGKFYQAQVLEQAKGDYCFDSIEMRHVCKFISQVAKEYHIYSNDDFWPSNMIAGRWLDFGSFDFKDYGQYQADATVKYNRCAKWGNGVTSAYQQFKEAGIEHGRGDVRVEMFELDSYDFKNKTVLDIGCSGGYFTNYCDKRGARAIGVDLPEVIDGTRQAANAFYYNSEFYPYDFSKPHFVETIRRITGIEKFDYVFFLSMDQHIGYRDDYFEDLVGGTLFFESNGGRSQNEEYNDFKYKLESLFPSVDFKGVSEEGAKRNLFVCQKKN